MARVATVPVVRTAGLHAWLLHREERALAAGGTLGWTPDQPSYTGDPERLEALRAGQPVILAASDLPRHARGGVDTPWWRWATVDRDGGVQFWDGAREWATENGL
jgi:hypothetical protein